MNDMTLPTGTPPGPRGHWLLGSLREFAGDVLAFTSRCAETYGPITHFRIGNWHAYLLNDPELAAVPLLAQHRNFTKNTFFWRHLSSLVGEGLLTSEGDFWRRQRKLAAPGFHIQRIAEYARVMTEETTRELDGWRAGETRDLHHDLMRLTSRIVARALFDADVSGDTDVVGDCMDQLSRQIRRRVGRPLKVPDWLPYPGNRPWNAAIRRLDEIVYRFIREHRESQTPKRTLLGMLMDARDEDGAPMSDQQLRDETITLFLAGHETTAIALAWAGYLLSQHPEVEATLAQELARVLNGRAPAFEDLPQLRYTEAVVRETMRLYPPAYLVGREAIAACDIGGWPIPAKAVIYVSPWTMHRNPKFFPEPAAFRPERWSPEFEKTLPRFAYLPFGGGPRVCIGDRFAVMEAVLLLAGIYQRWSLRYTASAPPRPYPAVTLRPEGGVPMKLSARG